MDQLNKAKDLLSEPKQRIKLYDFISQESIGVVSQINANNFDVQTPLDKDAFISRISKYEEILRGVLPIEMLIGRWLRDQPNISAIPLRRIAGGIGQTGGDTILIEARWYPIFLLLYSGCIGAVAGDNYEIISELAHIAVPNRFGRNNDDVLLVSVFRAMNQIHDIFRLFPGFAQAHTPRSEYIFSVLEKTANDTLYLGGDYDRLFDRVEMILSCEHIHIEHPDALSPNDIPRAPVGKFGWKTFGKNPLNQLIAEATAAGDAWPPVRGGLFGGSTKRFVEIAEGLNRLIMRYGW